MYNDSYLFQNSTHAPLPGGSLLGSPLSGGANQSMLGQNTAAFSPQTWDRIFKGMEILKGATDIASDIMTIMGH